MATVMDAVLGVAPANFCAKVRAVALSMWIVADPVTVGLPWIATDSTPFNGVALTAVLEAVMLISVASTAVPPEPKVIVVPLLMTAMT
jgi:hypothetical protein